MILIRPSLLMLLTTALVTISVSGKAQETSASFTEGAVKVGYDNRSCTTALTGAVRYSSALKCPELCDGTNWLNTSCSNEYGAALPTSENPCYGNGSGTCLFIYNSFSRGNLGGLSGADSDCAGNASSAGLTGTYKAVLSTSTVNAKDRFTITYPVVAPNGLIIEGTNLWAGSLENYPIYNAWGAPRSNEDTWSGSTSAGVKTADNCINWTSDLNTDDSNYGLTNNKDANWISYGTDGCNNFRYHYCMLATGL